MLFTCPGSQRNCKIQALLQNSKEIIIHNCGGMKEGKRNESERVHCGGLEDCISFSVEKVRVIPGTEHISSFCQGCGRQQCIN